MKGKKKKIQRIEIECIFARWGDAKVFVTLSDQGSLDAVNVIALELEQKGIKNQTGKLIFEFEESIPERISRKELKKIKGVGKRMLNKRRNQNVAWR